MAEHHWNKLKIRLATIMATGLNITFNNSPVRKKTSWGLITLRFFQIKLNGNIIWRFPENTEQSLATDWIYGVSKIAGRKRDYVNIEFPIQSIIKYLDLPIEQLSEYTDEAGLADILKVCDKRIGYNRLRTIKLSTQAQKIFEARFNKHHS